MEKIETDARWGMIGRIDTGSKLEKDRENRNWQEIQYVERKIYRRWRETQRIETDTKWEEIVRIEER